MKNKLQLFATAFTLLLLVLGAGSCKKKSIGDALAIAGTYHKVYLQSPDTVADYYRFYDNHTFSLLTQNNQGDRAVSRGIYQDDAPSVILYSANSLRSYFIVKNGDTLKLLGDLTKPDTYYDNIILVKDPAAPAEKDWVSTVNIITKLPEVNLNLDALALYNNELWTAYQYDAHLRSYNTATGVQDIVLNAGGFQALDADGSSVWVSGAGAKLRTLNPTTGAVIFSSASAPAGQITGVAINGNTIYCLTGSSGLLLYDIAGNTFTNALVNTGGALDMAFSGGYLYLCSYYYIYKMDPATFKIIKTYSVNGIGGLGGLASDGNSFWIYYSDQLNVPGYFAKINLD